MLDVDFNSKRLSVDLHKYTLSILQFFILISGVYFEILQYEYI